MKQLCEHGHREYQTENGVRLMDVVRKQFVHAGPEEYVRQDVVRTLIEKYGFPVSALLCEEVVERGAKKIDRADVIVELPRTTPGAVVELGEPENKPWWSDIPSYSAQYEYIAKTLDGPPGVKLISVDDEFPLRFGGEALACRTLGFASESYGNDLVLLMTEADSECFGLPRVVALRVQGYGMTEYEKSVAETLKIEQCEWTQPGCEEAVTRWATYLPRCPIAKPYYYNETVLSSDGVRMWGQILGMPSIGHGVLAFLDTEAKGLKKFLRDRNDALDALEGPPPEDTESGDAREEDEDQLSDGDTRTFIVVECKAPKINYTEKVLKQGLRYADRRKASYLVLTNGTWSYCYWSSPEKGWMAVDDVPTYSEALSGKYSIRSADPETPHTPMPGRVMAETVLLHARTRSSIGCDTEERKWEILLRLEDLLVTAAPVSDLPWIVPGCLTIREDWGPHWHEVGNPSGGNWPGKYRTFLVETASGTQFMFGVALLGMSKAVEHPSYGNRKSTSVLIGALSFDSQYHPGVQFAICQSMAKENGVWHFHHDGRITIGKGAGSRAALIDGVKAIAPELVTDGRIYLGSLPDSVLQWNHAKDFLARFASYTWLRHQFKEKARARRREQS